MATPRYASKCSAIVRSAKANRRADLALSLWGMGYSIDVIAMRMGFTRQTIHRLLRRTVDLATLRQTQLYREPMTPQLLASRLSEMFLGGSDIAEIIDSETDEFKPVHTWPLAWRMRLSGRDTEPINERSSDGVQAGENKSWDRVGTKQKYRFIDPLKLIEMCGRLKSVDAFVGQGQKVDVEIKNVTYRWQGDDEKNETVIDVTPPVARLPE